MAIRKRNCSVHFSNYFTKLKAAYKQNINEFLKNSTINGLRYINRRDFSIAERLYFIIAIVVALSASIFFVRLVVEKWSYSPTIISIKPRPTYIIDDPFPAVTICNMNQALNGIVMDLPIHSQEYAKVQMLCNRKANNSMTAKIEDWDKLGDFILNISQSCERMLLHCTFGGVQYNCSELFHPVLMDEGLCCAFNNLHPVFADTNFSLGFALNATNYGNMKPVDWSVEHGYESPLPKYFTPMKAVGAGQSLGLNVMLNVESEEYYCSSGNSIGFKILIHNPDEKPNIHETGVLISPGAESLVRIMPSKTESVEKLRQMNMNLRNCLFENESNLTYFSHYSYLNCMDECAIRLLQKRCGCKYYFMTSITCGSKYGKCLENIVTAESDCAQECWPSCFSKQYGVNIFSAKLEDTGIEMNNPKLENMSMAYVQKNIAIVKFYMEQSTYFNTQQAPYIGAVDALSSIGGLICIFFGFSFISLAEFIYYICIRPWRPTTQTNAVSLRKPRPLLLFKQSKTHFEYPYSKNQTYKLKTHRGLALPRKA